MCLCVCERASQIIKNWKMFVHLLNVLIVNIQFIILYATICVNLETLSIHFKHTKCYALYKIYSFDWKKIVRILLNIFDICIPIHKCWILDVKTFINVKCCLVLFLWHVNIPLFSIQVTGTSCRRWSSTPESPIGFLKTSRAPKKKKSKYTPVCFINSSVLLEWI